MFELDTPQERQGKETHHCEGGRRQHPKDPCAYRVEGKVGAYLAKERGHCRHRFSGAESHQQDACKRSETPPEWPSLCC
ncbi:hypothetical protein NtRootA1_21780 [Arthrobacter sp. NtRootA1]|nr:hypothetical protein NtRootA1_21780 [Arthrobacter sp. NtRootA1]